ncbi:sialate O-acetylesterase [Tichowtungia aerotolerans]|uniref:Sialate O-acetylesterase domain-containing protein n=1 Tax=Tichowtungia aerotolerans TaxID=2697043 RepID=A0A6P1M2A2_9BACT|nr:sialate O-acetylesterase [Tichowtungia aerotolerans]QHI68710.1 hypothetical protein GT409_04360 [Tichowtungia aerotolerans]
MRRFIFSVLCQVSAVSLSCFAAAGLTLDGLFMDNMVLQRGKPLPVFGTAEPGAEITVEFAGQKKSGVTSALGEWQVVLDPMKASSTGCLLRVSSFEFQVSLSNLLVGDVWLCGGQSNMDTPVRNYPFLAKELEGVSNDRLRLFNVDFNAAKTPQEDVSGEGIYKTWLVADESSVPVFSAVGICFGLRLQRESGVPIGVIESAVGGSEVSPWMSATALEAMGQSALQAPSDRGVPPRSQPSVLYNGMIHALCRLPIKGVIWYQGESNASQPSIVRYDQLFEGLIASWRDVFGDSDLPFYFVQLAPYGRVHWDRSGESWAWVREAQEKTLSLPYTGRVVITDLGEYSDIHPMDKKPVGERLADLALRDMGLLDTPGFPKVGKYRIAGPRVQLDFSNVGKGLKTVRVAMNQNKGLAPGTDPEACVVDTDTLSGFEMCGADHLFVPASAAIVGADTVEVWSDDVANPVAVRYGWANFPLCNLANSAGLPASPFRTDDFPMPVFKAPFLDSAAADSMPVGAIACSVMEKPDESLMKPERIAGREALRMSHVATVLRMAYYHAGDAALRNGQRLKQCIVVNYLDDGPGAIEFTYDAVSKPWKSAGLVEMKGSGQWRQFRVWLDDARFSGRCNGADFRLQAFRDVYIGDVYTEPVE